MYTSQEWYAMKQNKIVLNDFCELSGQNEAQGPILTLRIPLKLQRRINDPLALYRVTARKIVLVFY